MLLRLLIVVTLAVAYADKEEEARFLATLKPASAFITLTNPVTVTATTVVTPTCYEPAEKLSLCRRKKKQLALLLDPFGYGSQIPLNLYQPLGNPLDAGFEQAQFLDARSNLKAQQAYPAAAIDPSFRDGNLGYMPDQFLQLFGGFLTSTTGPQVTAVVTSTADKTQTVALDCVVLGSSLPSNLCDISMIFPLPPSSIELSDYCSAIAQLSGFATDACELTPLVDGTGVFVRFKAEFDISNAIPSRKAVIKNILKGLLIYCDIKADSCTVPGLPDGFKFNPFKIFIPGVQNIRDFIILALNEITGTSADCTDNNILALPSKKEKASLIQKKKP